MKKALAFAHCSVDEIKAVLDGGTLAVYSVARPATPDLAVDRSGLLATFTFASPAFGVPSEGLETPAFIANPVAGNTVGTFGFVRLCKADGAAVADLSAGPGHREIKFSEVSCSPGAPVTLTKFNFMAEGDWPEKPEYFDTHPRTGFPMPKHP